MGLPLFNITMRCHYFIHAAYRAKHVSPRLVWCFQGEDYMHHSKVLASSCLRGNNMTTAGKKMIKKMSYGMHLNFIGKAGY